MKTTSRIYSILLTILITINLTACSDTQNMNIPAVNETTINEAAETLGISTEKFKSFLDSMATPFDTFVEDMNADNKTIKEFRDEIEKNYDCTFEQYVDTVLAVSNKTTPDEEKYVLIKSDFSLFDAYIPSDELNENNDKLVNYDVNITVSDNDEDSYAFDVLQTQNYDLRMYMNILTKLYGCKSAEFSNIKMLGGYGSIKPEESNPCMDGIFIYDDKTGEILEELIVSALTLHFDNSEKDMTLALSNELGLMFKATGADSFEKISKLENLRFQIRKTTTTSDDN